MYKLETFIDTRIVSLSTFVFNEIDEKQWHTSYRIVAIAP